MIRHFTAYEPNAWGVCGHKHPTIASAAKCAAKDSRREVREVRGSMIMAAVLVPSRATVSACGETKGGLLALQLLPADMDDPVAPKGSQGSIFDARPSP